MPRSLAGNNFGFLVDIDTKLYHKYDHPTCQMMWLSFPQHDKAKNKTVDLPLHTMPTLSELLNRWILGTGNTIVVISMDFLD